MKKPKNGWKTPNAWLIWKMYGWTLEEIKYAFLAVIPRMSGLLIRRLWETAMREDGYYSGPPDVQDVGEPDVIIHKEVSAMEAQELSNAVIVIHR